MYYCSNRHYSYLKFEVVQCWNIVSKFKNPKWKGNSRQSAFVITHLYHLTTNIILQWDLSTAIAAFWHSRGSDSDHLLTVNIWSPHGHSSKDWILLVVKKNCLISFSSNQYALHQENFVSNNINNNFYLYCIFFCLFLSANVSSSICLLCPVLWWMKWSIQI